VNSFPIPAWIICFTTAGFIYYVLLATNIPIKALNLKADKGIVSKEHKQYTCTFVLLV
jgi:hypothetical protein